MEIWKEISENPMFEVSNLGNIRNGRTKILLKKIISDEFEEVYLPKVNEFYVHRIVAKEFIDNDEGYNIVLHKNGDKTDNRAENLEWSNTSKCMNKYIEEHGHWKKYVCFVCVDNVKLETETIKEMDSILRTVFNIKRFKYWAKKDIPKKYKDRIKFIKIKKEIFTND